MFSLIVTLISIALVAALALATIYYGGTAFTNGQTRAEAVEAINAAQQITGANQVLTATTGAGAGAATLDELVTTGYLASIPRGDWQLAAGHAVRADMTANSCLAANQALGINLVPSCDDPAYASSTVCCQVTE